MAELLGLALYILVVYAVGWSILSILFYGMEFQKTEIPTTENRLKVITKRFSCNIRFPYPFEKAALSFPIGVGLVTLQMALMSYLGIRWTAKSITVWWLPVFFSGIALTMSNRGCPRMSAGRREGRLSLSEKFLIGALVFQITYVFFRALIKPLEAYDAIAIYGLKAKIFYLAQGIPQNFFSSFREFVPHIEYPLLLPLAESAMYVFLGNLNDLAVKIVFGLYYLSMLAVFYAVVRRGLSRGTSILLTFLLASVPQFSEYATNGYADFLLAFYYSASVLYLYLWAREKRAEFLILSVMMSGLAVWTKTEALMLACANMLAVLFHVRKERECLRQAALYIIYLTLIIAAYIVISKKLGLTIHGDLPAFGITDMGRIASNIGRLPLILYEYQIQFFGPKKWNIVWIIFMIAVVIKARCALSGKMRLLTLVLFFIFCGYTAVYLVTPQNVSWHISTTASRFFIHFLPVAMLWISCAGFFNEEL